MARSRSRRASRSASTDRRSLLRGGALVAALGGGGWFLLPTNAFTATKAGRSATVDVADDDSAYLGIVGQGPVKKKQRDPMVELTNNTTTEMSITVTLQSCSDGTLYNNEGDSGCSVTFSLGSGNSKYVDIVADVTGTIPYDITMQSDSVDIATTNSVEAEAGNTKGAIRIQAPNKDQDFTADRNFNEFTVAKVDIRDDDDDDDLDKVEFRVEEGGSGGTVVASKDVTDPPADRYNPKGNPAETILPDNGYTIKANTTYSLTARGIDADGNFDSETVEDTT